MSPPHNCAHAGAIPAVERYLRSLRQAPERDYIWLAILSDAKTCEPCSAELVHGPRFLPGCTPLDPLLSYYPIELAASRLTRHPIR